MSKLPLQLVSLIIFVLLFVFLVPKTALAADCTITFNPDPPNQNMDKLSLTIFSNDLKSGNYVARGAGPITNQAFNAEAAKSIINFVIGQTSAVTLNPPSAVSTSLRWVAGHYTVYIVEENQRHLSINDIPKVAVCQKGFDIVDIPQQEICTINIETKTIDPDTEVVLNISNIIPGEYDMFVNNKFAIKYNTSVGNRAAICTGDLKKIENCRFSAGIYTVAIKKDDRMQCNLAGFKVDSKGGGGGGPINIGPGTAGPVATPCPSGDPKCSSGGGKTIPGCGDTWIPDPTDSTKFILNPSPKNPAIATAIGCIHTNPAELVKDLLKFMIAIGGGLAFLMMLLGAFQMLTSQGNPETLNAGKERLTSAAIGLLFIIFAVLLLQIIGADILQIPGFGR